MRVRRRKHTFLTIEDRLFPDLELLLQGELKLKTVTHTLLVCPLSGEKILVAPADVARLATLSAEDWAEVGEGFEALAASGAVIADTESGRSLLEREAQLEGLGWHPAAALFHRQSAWSGMDAQVESSSEELKVHLDAHAAAFGMPPHHFFRVPKALAEVALPLPGPDDALTTILRQRRSVRAFLQDEFLKLADLSAVLHTTFGIQGLIEWAPGMAVVKKFTPSGGGLHPIEAWPLVARVEGLEPGLYHFRTEDHVLELVERIAEAEVRALITTLTSGQTYFAGAQVCVIHVARFERNFWKYRGHSKAYKAVGMDSAHLSQTFFIQAAARGLGAYFTAALNDTDFAKRMGWDGLQLGAVAVNGLGIPDLDPEHGKLDFHPDPYVPWEHRRG